MKKSIKFKDFIYEVLLSLYEFENVNNSTGFVDITDIFKNNEIPQKWFGDASNLLQTMGFVDSAILLDGSVFCSLTGKGRLEAEKIREKKKQKSIILYEIIKAANEPIVVENNGRKLIQILLDKIENSIKSNTSFNSDKKHNLLNDVSTLRLQFERNEPNKEIIGLVLPNLLNEKSIFPSAAELVRFFNSSFEIKSPF